MHVQFEGPFRWLESGRSSPTSHAEGRGEEEAASPRWFCKVLHRPFAMDIGWAPGHSADLGRGEGSVGPRHLHQTFTGSTEDEHCSHKLRALPASMQFWEVPRTSNCALRLLSQRITCRDDMPSRCFIERSEELDQ